MVQEAKARLNEEAVKGLAAPERGSKIHYFAGAIIQGSKAPRGFGVRVTAGGVRSFVLRYRVRGSEHLYVIGQYPDWSVLRAVKEARTLRQRIDRGDDPLEVRRKEETADENTVKAVLEKYLTIECGMKRDNMGKATFNSQIRSAPQKLDVFERFVYPQLGSGDVNELKRSQINDMLDKIEDENGPVMADRTLAHLRRALNWHASRCDDFRSPIVKGMAKTKPKERAGKRVLADDEIRDIFTVLATPAKGIPECFARLQRLLFFAAVRRTEASAMVRTEITFVTRDDEFKGNVWTVPAARMKGKLDHAVPLNAQIAAEIGEQPADAAGPYVFSTTGGAKPFSGYDKAKRALDRELAALRKREGREPMAPWTMQRDVRRTARTLMSRAGVPFEIAERVIAHVVPGVAGVYDRWGYLPEKADAYKKLAALIERIVNPPADNVSDLGEHRSRRQAK